MRHLIDFSDLTQEEWHALYHSFTEILKHPGDYRDALRGQTLASLFYEPSTRTRLSFEAAMQRLGGGVFGFSDPQSSSIYKGESLKDTIAMVSGYADAVVIRHPREGSALAASLYSTRPVVNAGDGGHCHPTQTLTDLAAVTLLLGQVDGLHIGICGDLKYGRTVHSLLSALRRFDGITVTLISAPELALPAYARAACEEAGMALREERNLRSAIGGLDVLYMTRVQRERFADPAEYERLKDGYILTPGVMEGAKREMLVMHPLPRFGEIDVAVDDDPRAAYFEQARLGMVIRMALLLETCRLPSLAPKIPQQKSGFACANPRCVTQEERYLPPLADGDMCRYCESRAG
ncbi:MAG: aspartate carbamoyltransferase [Oscillospiraceae bacterium]|nr:aspartate carbamoyltransferase [Oscillospiraceae bacterium]